MRLLPTVKRTRLLSTFWFDGYNELRYDERGGGLR